MKLTTVTFLNFGLVMMCFGLMARQNQCSRNLVDTFFGAGQFALSVTGIFLLIVSELSHIPMAQIEALKVIKGPRPKG